MSLCYYLVVTPTKCAIADWIGSLKKGGRPKCEEDNLFISGFYRLNPPNNISDPISSLEQPRCCSSSPEFIGQDGTCKYVLWGNSLER